MNKAQTKALATLKDVSEETFQELVSNPTNDFFGDNEPVVALKDLSSREITRIAEQIEEEKPEEEPDVSAPQPEWSIEVKVTLMDRLGIPLIRIAGRLGIHRETVAKYAKEAVGLFEEVRQDINKGLSIPETAIKHTIPEALTWAVVLEEKTDQERFEALGWGLRVYDDWRFLEPDSRFGDIWPGNIPAQLVAHALFYMSDPGDLIFDPMAGGGVVSDTCLVFGRRCWSFEMVDRLECRPEIFPYLWDRENLKWPVMGKEKPNLILFDPPYFKKMEKYYEDGSISGLSKKDYLDFMKSFFSLAHKNSAPSARFAFINADWRDLQGKSFREEDGDNAVLSFDYWRLLSESGWKVQQDIMCPLSSQRFLPYMVTAMQKTRSMGSVSRYLLSAIKK